MLFGLAATLALESVLAFAAVLAFGVVERLRAAETGVGSKSRALAGLALSARHDTRDSGCDENGGHDDVFLLLWLF
jgi:hypothetical protein